MKSFGKKVLKYVLIALVLFITSINLFTYFKNKSFGFDISHATSGVVLAITFFGTVGFMLFELFQVVDGKGKHKKGNIKKAINVNYVKYLQFVSLWYPESTSSNCTFWFVYFVQKVDFCELIHKKVKSSH